MKKHILSYIVFLTLSACNTSNINTANVNQKLSSSSSRLIFDRPATGLAFLASARVFINGTQVASISNGDKYVHDVEPGIVVVKVDNALNPGQFVATFKVESGKIVKFKIVPNSSYLLMGGLFGVAGLITDITVNQNSGVFALEIDRN